jgi:hypothetical protein
MAASTSESSMQPRTLRIIGIMIIAAVVIVSVVALGFRGPGGGNTMSPTQTLNIVNGLVTVNAGDYEYFQFVVPVGASNVHVEGSFTASGTWGNDIEVLIVDSMDFVNWQNGYQASTYYNSGQLSNSSFDVPRPSVSRAYYLVYSNTFSIMSNKNVNTQANLSYIS